MKIFLVVVSMLASSLSFGKTVPLKNGSFLDAEADANLPRQSVVLVFPGGPALVPKNLQGATEVVTEILAEGPASMKAEDYRQALFLSNAEIKVSASLRAMFVVIKAPAAKLAAAMELAAKTLAEPRLDAVNFKEAHAKIVSQTAQNFEQMQAVVFFYGMRAATLDNPDIYDGSGSPATVKNITLENCKEIYSKIFERKHLYFVAAGPGSDEEISKEIDRVFLSDKETPKFAALPGRDIDPSNIIKKSPKGLRVTIINKPGATDNQVLFVYPEPIRRAQQEEVTATVAHMLLGGGLTGRLGKVLRKERGLTYHAGSFVAQPGWMIYTFGGDDQIEALLAGTSEVVQAFKKEKISADEVKETLATLDNRHRQRYELPGDALMERIKLRLFAHDEGFVENYQKMLSGVKAPDIQGFIKSKINTESGILVLMGDAEKLQAVLKKSKRSLQKAHVLALDQVM